MKRKLISLSLLALSATMMLESPVLAATGRSVTPSAYTSFSGNGYAAYKTSAAKADGTSMTSRSAYGVIYNGKYAASTDALLQKFNKANESLYMSQGLSDSFPYFNADQYLEKYPEVKEGLTALLSDEEKKDPDALRKAALNHYVQYGMLEGRDCGTAFNPVIALLAYPELYQDVSDLSADNVRNIFLSSVHAEDTSEFSIYFYQVNDREMLSIVRNKKDSTAMKYTMPDVLADAGFSTEKTNSADQKAASKENSADQKETKKEDAATTEEKNEPKESTDTSDETGDSDASADQDSSKTKDSGTPFVLPAKINNLAKDVTPYKLYSTTGNSDELDISGKATDNYKLIKDKLTNKYTMMVYMCGTDLEDRYNSLSDSVLKMLQSAPKNMNVVLLIGGTDDYGSNYLNNMIGKEKIGIFYLDPSKLPEDQDFDDAFNSSDYDKVINKDTLVNLATFDSANIGDPSLLSGFMNLSTDLFHADNYGLIMWNHGGGVVGNICSPDTKYVTDGKGFDTNDLESAFRSSNLIKKGGKLGMLSFDACLMGCSEIAYNLHNYYNYMFASEEIELDDFKYYKMFTDMDSRLSEGKANDYAMIKAIYDNFSYKDGTDTSHTGQSALQQTGSVYDGSATEKFMTALNDMGKELNQLIHVSPEHKKDVLRTLAIARMKCETLCIGKDDTWSYGEPKYADVGELAYYLNADLTALKKEAVAAGESEDYIKALEKSIDSVKALQKTGCLVMTSTWYNRNMVRSYAGQQAISMEDLETKAPAADFWRKTQGTASSYGTSVYFPCLFSNSDDDTLTKYADFYSGTALSDYSAFMDEMISWKKSDEYKAQYAAMNDELNGIRKFASSHIEDYGDSTSPHYLVVKFKEQYDTDNKPADSFGSPMYDVMVTTTCNPTVYATSQIKDSKGNVISTYHKIDLKNNVSGEHFNLADSSLNVQTNTLSGYGIHQDGINAKDSLDFKLIEYDENGDEYKNGIVSAINNAYTDKDANKYKILEGTYSCNDIPESFIYHIFRKADVDDVFVYAGSSKQIGDKKYVAVNNGSQITFYNHYLHNLDNGSIEHITEGYTQFPEDIPEATKYSIGKGANPIYLEKFTLSSDGTNHYDPDNFGFATSLDFTYHDAAGNNLYETEYSGACYTNAAWDAPTSTAAKASTETKASTDLNTETNTDTNADVNTDTKTDTDTNTDTGIDANTDVNTDINTDVTIDTNLDADTNVSTDTKTDVTADQESESSESGNTEITSTEDDTMTEAVA